MNVLLVAREPRRDIEERWAKLGIRATHVSPGHLLDLVQYPLELQQVLADAIALACDPIPDVTEMRATDAVDVVDASRLAVRIRSLGEQHAMPDGRRWSALPIAFLVDDSNSPEADGVAARLEAEGYRDIRVAVASSDSDHGASQLKAAVKKYRQNILHELDNLGFVVAYEGGRYRLGPALKPRPELVGYYYFGPADQRTDHFVTVDRDLVGIQLEVELFEALLNRKNASEGDFQKFFEEHSHFLSLLSTPLPHVQLRDSEGKLLVPDFILKPVVASQRDSRWEVLDLKRAEVSLIVGKGSRRRLSKEVMDAVRQLRDYGNYFADPRNTGTIEHALGHRLRKPKLGVLIGRMVEVELEALELEQSRLPDVRIITYDEILEQQKSLAS
jgi:hypothetical protein